MPGRGDRHEQELTAQPKGLPEEVGTTSVLESGLSMDPEDLGRQFLSDAVEQGNFESQRGGEAFDLWLSSNPLGDAALTGPNFEVDHSVWESTASLALQNGSPELAQQAASPRTPSSDGEQREDEEDYEGIGADGDIDLTESVIQEASLLDHEADELGETESPSLSTDDNHTHAKRRGGHAPRRLRHALRVR